MPPDGPGRRLLLPGRDDARAARWRRRASTTATSGSATPGYEVIGVSIDQTAKNDEFRSECGLDFPLVSDEDASLTTDST